MEKFNVVFKKSALKQLKLLPQKVQQKILTSIAGRLTSSPQIADGKHIRKLTEGFRLRVGDYRIFYYVDLRDVIITSVVRRTSTTY